MVNARIHGSALNTNRYFFIPAPTPNISHQMKGFEPRVNVSWWSFYLRTSCIYNLRGGEPLTLPGMPPAIVSSINNRIYTDKAPSRNEAKIGTTHSFKLHGSS
jgi:hypothetical protein